MNLKSLSPFQIARLQLTAWYTLIGAILLILFTYFTFEARNAAYIRVYRVLDKNSPGSSQVVEFADKYEDLNRQYRQRFLLFDLVIFVALTTLSYYFSGKTLEPIQKMSKEQAAFAADVSHSLRTPLATMKIEIEAFARSRLRIPKDMQDILKSLNEEIVHMTNITEGLLTLVRADNRNVYTSWSQVSLNEVIELTGNQLRPMSQAKNQHLELRVGQEKKVHGNVDQLKQVLLIFIENAIKYTPKKGKVMVKLGSRQGRVVITVADSGPGIAKQDIPYIFDRFYRAKTAKKTAGSGLGLAIAAKIVALHHGNIAVSSRVGSGTTFHLSFPATS